MLYPFQPIPGSGSTYAPNAGATDITVKKGARQYCVTNLSTTVVYVRIDAPNPPGSTAAHAAATIADQAVLGGTSIVLTKEADSEAGSVYCAGVGSVQITSGLGN